MTTYRTGNAPDVDHARGAEEALCAIRARLIHASKLGQPITEATVWQMLRDTAAALGVDETVRESASSATLAAQAPATEGRDRADDHSGSQPRPVECKLVRPAGPGPTDPCDCFVSQPCAMQHTREPERKADQP